MQDNLISVVIPSFSAYATLPFTLASLSRSSLRPSSIVVEDGICHQTSRILDQHPDIFRVRRHPARGASSARNDGLQLVSTPYVMFLDADDLVGTDQLEHACRVLSDSGADLCLTPWSFHDQKRPFGTIKTPLPGIDNRRRILDWLSNQCFPPCSVVWRTNSIRSLGGWDPLISYNDDADLMIRAFFANYSVTHSRVGCGYYVQHHSSVRLSRSPAVVVDLSNNHLYEMVIKHLPGLDAFDAQQVLGIFSYEQARRQYREGHIQSGQRWLNRAQSHGCNDHPGTLAHQVTVRLLGLPLKERLAGLRDSHPWLRHRFG